MHVPPANSGIHYYKGFRTVVVRGEIPSNTFRNSGRFSLITGGETRETLELLQFDEVELYLNSPSYSDNVKALCCDPVTAREKYKPEESGVGIDKGKYPFVTEHSRFESLYSFDGFNVWSAPVEDGDFSYFIVDNIKAEEDWQKFLTIGPIVRSKMAPYAGPLKLYGAYVIKNVTTPTSPTDLTPKDNTYYFKDALSDDAVVDYDGNLFKRYLDMTNYDFVYGTAKSNYSDKPTFKYRFYNKIPYQDEDRNDNSRPYKLELLHVKSYEVDDEGNVINKVYDQVIPYGSILSLIDKGDITPDSLFDIKLPLDGKSVTLECVKDPEGTSLNDANSWYVGMLRVKGSNQNYSAQRHPLKNYQGGGLKYLITTFKPTPQELWRMLINKEPLPPDINLNETLCFKGNDDNISRLYEAGPISYITPEMPLKRNYSKNAYTLAELSAMWMTESIDEYTLVAPSNDDSQVFLKIIGPGNSDKNNWPEKYKDNTGSTAETDDTDASFQKCIEALKSGPLNIQPYTVNQVIQRWYLNHDNLTEDTEIATNYPNPTWAKVKDNQEAKKLLDLLVEQEGWFYDREIEAPYNSFLDTETLRVKDISKMDNNPTGKYAYNIYGSEFTQMRIWYKKNDKTVGPVSLLSLYSRNDFNMDTLVSIDKINFMSAGSDPYFENFWHMKTDGGEGRPIENGYIFPGEAFPFNIHFHMSFLGIKPKLKQCWEGISFSTSLSDLWNHYPPHQYSMWAEIEIDDYDNPEENIAIVGQKGCASNFRFKRDGNNKIVWAVGAGASQSNWLESIKLCYSQGQGNLMRWADRALDPAILDKLGKHWEGKFYPCTWVTHIINYITSALEKTPEAFIYLASRETWRTNMANVHKKNALEPDTDVLEQSWLYHNESVFKLFNTAMSRKPKLLLHFIPVGLKNPDYPLSKPVQLLNRTGLIGKNPRFSSNWFIYQKKSNSGGGMPGSDDPGPDQTFFMYNRKTPPWGLYNIQLMNTIVKADPGLLDVCYEFFLLNVQNYVNDIDPNNSMEQLEDRYIHSMILYPFAGFREKGQQNMSLHPAYVFMQDLTALKDSYGENNNGRELIDFNGEKKRYGNYRWGGDKEFDNIQGHYRTKLIKGEYAHQLTDRVAKVFALENADTFDKRNTILNKLDILKLVREDPQVMGPDKIAYETPQIDPSAPSNGTDKIEPKVDPWNSFYKLVPCNLIINHAYFFPNKKLLDKFKYPFGGAASKKYDYDYSEFPDDGVDHVN
jgi:hypothetical protein